MTRPRVLWSVADFARFAFGVDEPTKADHVRARRMLLRLDRKHGGGLLLRDGPASSRLYMVAVARLRTCEPDLFETPAAWLAERIDALEAAAEKRTEHVLELARTFARARDAHEARMAERARIRRPA